MKACQAVAFGCNGVPLYRPRLAVMAEGFYGELLGSLAKAIAKPGEADGEEMRLVAMLLGVHQVSLLCLSSGIVFVI